MSLQIHSPYPGVALLVTDAGSVLLGAPADAFKATKRYCNENDLPFPRDLVAPQAMLREAAPQFNPEFFLYDFLFVYGAAFKPELAGERLRLVLDEDQVQGALDALRITLSGPTRDELKVGKTEDGSQAISDDVIQKLCTVAEHMAIKKGDAPRTMEDMVETITFDGAGKVELLGGQLTLERKGMRSFVATCGDQSEDVDLNVQGEIVPFATLPIPTEIQRPLTFGVKPLGTRNGFDLSGPTTGFVIWVNGRAVLYDGPVGTHYLLRSQGISAEDVDAVVLSHCHEDHMGAFVELILGGYRPKVITAEPIYRSALIKLAGYFRKTPQEVAEYIDYQRAVPGQPMELLGARFEFFYTVHSIPTVGLRVSMQDHRGTTHAIQISGDTMHHEGLDKMHADGIIDDGFFESMRHLVPDEAIPNTLYYADVGEAIIHGHPKDWAQNPNEIIYYHCPDNEHTQSFGKALAMPGVERALITARQMHPATPGRLLKAMSFLGHDHPLQMQRLLFGGEIRTANTGNSLKTKGNVSVIVSGQVEIRDDKDSVMDTLGPGEFFGDLAILCGPDADSKSAVATTPVELFDLSETLLAEYIHDTGQEEDLESMWSRRNAVDACPLFRQLEIVDRNRLAQASQLLQSKKGDVLKADAYGANTLCVIISGQAEIATANTNVKNLSPNDEYGFFGEGQILGLNDDFEVVANEDCTLLAIDTEEAHSLFENHMGLRFSLETAHRLRHSN